MTTTFDEQYGNPGRGKFLIGGLLILVAVVYLIISSTSAAAQYFFTVDELFDRGSTVIGTPSKVTGAVMGETIQYDAETLTLSFTIAHMPADNDLLELEGGLAQALNAAVNDPTRTHMQVEYIGPKPDLLRHEAQAILTGTMAEDGIFYADELLLKCPTRYEEAAPGQTVE
jgi:cytochrome c-type biogenesis protein CcmE